MKKSNKYIIKKIFLFLSLFPYFCFIYIGISNFATSLVHDGYFNLYFLIKPIIDFWFEIISDTNIILMLFTFFCVAYPISYLIDENRKKRKIKNRNDKVNKCNILFTLFIMSFIPYLYLVYSCIFGIEGLFFNNSIYYGFSAIYQAFLIFSLIPIYPTIILFQFIYFLKEYKNISFKYKKITRAIIFFLLLLLIVPSISYKIIGNRSINIQYENDKIIIEKYLKEVFGEKYYKNMEILKPKDNLSSSYKVNTPLLNENFTITLDDEKKVILNSFYEEFVKENKLNDRLSSYLKMYYDFPSYYEINSSIYNFQINKINDIDDLIKDCEFKIKYFNINILTFNI